MDVWQGLVGADSHSITWWQMGIRAVLIFCAGLILVRLGGKRTFGKTTSFDIVVSVILGSILSRALTANSPLLPTLAGAGVLMLLHFTFARIALWSTSFGHLVKGIETELIRDGHIQWDAMHKTNMTPHDLREAARLKGVRDLNEIQTAYLERSGSVSVFKKSSA